MNPAPLIICFGDSLTVGYQSPTPASPDFRETPYGAFLQELLGPAARVLVSGICGELTGEMAMRFRPDVLQHRPAYVVVLGGTNDLGWNARPPDIMRNLLKMYESALAAGVQPVAVTIPSIRLGMEEGEDSSTPWGAGSGGTGGQRWVTEHIERRQTLNRLISDYSTSRRVAWIDLFAATQEPRTMQLAAVYSNDGLHLNTDGYRRLATLLYEQVFAARLTRQGRLGRPTA
ncbi:MAG: SGNH/GDSL hydrolase family protein [Nitrospiraceae bacterium]